jgi:DNA-binding winged helix-turn-helix (wHTH) protein/tetratricopeptide (TPR) repeat protein
MASATFGPFSLDLTSGELRRSGAVLKLQPQPSKLLILLVERAGELVTRDEIRRRVWGNETFVDFDQSVNFCVRQIRAALHDHADEPCFVETLPRRGYRFIAPVQRVSDVTTSDPASIPVVPRLRPVRWRWVAVTCFVLLIAAAAAASIVWRQQQRPSIDRPDTSKGRYEVELGHFFLNKFSADGAIAAMEHFEAAVREDPNYAPAYAGLAESYNQLGSVFIASKPPANVRLLALRAATRAIQLDPNLAEAYAALGYTTLHEFDWTNAEAALRRAVELSPRYVPARQAYAGYLAARGRFTEAIEEARRGVDFQPASVGARQTLAWMLYFARQYDAAVRELRTILQMDRTYALAHFRLGQILIVTGRSDDAVLPLQTAVQLTNRGPAALGLLAMAYGRLGQRAEAQRIVEELERRAAIENIPAGAVLLAYIGVGDTARAIEVLERGYVERDNYEVNIASDPLMDPLRSEPRFDAICRQVMLGTASEVANVAAPKRSLARR